MKTENVQIILFRLFVLEWLEVLKNFDHRLSVSLLREKGGHTW